MEHIEDLFDRYDGDDYHAHELELMSIDEEDSLHFEDGSRANDSDVFSIGGERVRYSPNNVLRKFENLDDWMI